MSDSFMHSVAGAGGGIVAMTATYPLVFLSTRSAVEVKNENNSTYQAIVDVIRREGFLGLYSGLESSLLGIAVTNGVYYYFYERSRDIVLKSRKRSKGLTTAESILTGIIAGSVTTIISNPIWVVQTAQAVSTMDQESSTSSQLRSTPKKRGFLETVQTIMAKDGIRAFWRGIGPALVLVINPVLQYTVFEQLKNLLIATRTGRKEATKIITTADVLSDWDFFLLGALSKLVATASTYPYIVVKSRLQASRIHALKYTSLNGVFIILREEGVQGLYKGMGSKLMQSVLTAAILFATQRRMYEMINKLLSKS